MRKESKVTIDGITRTRTEWCDIYHLDKGQVVSFAKYHHMPFEAALLYRANHKARKRRDCEAGRGWTREECDICLNCKKISCSKGYCEKIDKWGRMTIYDD